MGRNHRIRKRSPHHLGVFTLEAFYFKRCRLPPDWVKNGVRKCADALRAVESDGADLKYVLFVMDRYRDGRVSAAHELYQDLESAARRVREKQRTRVRNAIRAEWEKRRNLGSLVARELIRLYRPLLGQRGQARRGQGQKPRSLHLILAVGKLVDHFDSTTGRKLCREAGILVDAFFGTEDFTKLVEDSGYARAKARYQEYRAHLRVLTEACSCSEDDLRAREWREFRLWLGS